MTTTVTIKAGCAANRYVQVDINMSSVRTDTFVLQDGEVAERTIHSNQLMVIGEVPKPGVQSK